MTTKKLLKISLVSVIATTIIAAPSFATIQDCVNAQPNLSTEKTDEMRIKCVTVSESGSPVTIYGKSSADCASAGAIASNPDCESGTSEAETNSMSMMEYVDEEFAKTNEKIKNLEKQLDEFKNKNKLAEEENATAKIITIIAIAVSAIALILSVLAMAKKSKAVAKKPATPAAPVAPDNSQNPFNSTAQ